ncbi:MAG: polysaccharide deacetylase family protein [Thermoanaerobacteraceae bacterium]|nr:polysaccharide deacetylase family protein [Thermoanaerobacteraceae bacterium]
MYVVYVPKRILLVWSTLLILVILFSAWWYLWRQVTVPTTVEPIYQGEQSKKQMALTFNVDWGQEYLPDILSILREKGVKATFFLTGRWTKKYPEHARKIAEAGHEIGNHGLKHRSPNQMTEQQNREDIKQAENYIKEVTGVKTKLFAPASGERQDHVLRAADSLGYTTILWSIDTIDWRKNRTADQILSKVLDKAHNGAIVLMHPTQATVQALPNIIDNLLAQGYQLKTVSQILPETN